MYALVWKIEKKEKTFDGSYEDEIAKINLMGEEVYKQVTDIYIVFRKTQKSEKNMLALEMEVWIKLIKHFWKIVLKYPITW